MVASTTHVPSVCRTVVENFDVAMSNVYLSVDEVTAHRRINAIETPKPLIAATSSLLNDIKYCPWNKTERMRVMSAVGEGIGVRFSQRIGTFYDILPVWSAHIGPDMNALVTDAQQDLKYVGIPFSDYVVDRPYSWTGSFIALCGGVIGYFSQRVRMIPEAELMPLRGFRLLMSRVGTVGMLAALGTFAIGLPSLGVYVQTKKKNYESAAILSSIPLIYGGVAVWQRKNFLAMLTSNPHGLQFLTDNRPFFLRGALVGCLAGAVVYGAVSYLEYSEVLADASEVSLTPSLK